MTTPPPDSPAPRYEPLRGLALWGEEEKAAALEVLESRSLFRYYGPAPLHRVDAFEERFAALAGAPHAVAVSSGTAALTCALIGLGIPEGAEVIVPAATFLGCVNAVVAARGVPVFADIDESLTLDPTAWEHLVTDRTFAVMPVHLHQAAADLDPVLAVQLERLPPMLRRLRDIARTVRADLADLGLRWRPLPDEEGSGGDLTLLLDDRMAARRLVTALTAAGVPAGTLYQGRLVHQNPAVRTGRTPWGTGWQAPGRLRASEAILGRSVTVGLGAAMTDDDVAHLAKSLRAAVTGAPGE
ncbi:DegT/DnrJ/EryC1/StrS family aminotransferase [Streptomyces sp. NPDC058461]|uniref:DegT/DnrJ/EryC1/StrS family aminotransferase n=1 Tax=Streptomyces sp. NPDC058461 TaxID=3346509 RepID=UPI00364E4533